MTSSHKLISPEYQETALPERTQGSMFYGRVNLAQHRRGYRYSADAVLLSHFASQHDPMETLDVGTGCGVIPLLLADLWSQRGATPALTAVERQAALATLAQDNVTANRRQSQITIVEADVRTWKPERQWPVITCNPPFFSKEEGNISPNPERAAARHELHGSLSELIQAMASLLLPTGHLMLVYPAPSTPRLLQAIQHAKLHVVRQRWVQPREETPANLVLLAASRTPSPCLQPKPLVLYRTATNRDYTQEASALFAGIV